MNITPYNTKGQRHGYWEYYWTNGELAFKCIYINGETNGFAEYYWRYNGKLTDKNYHI